MLNSWSGVTTNKAKFEYLHRRASSETTLELTFQVCRTLDPSLAVVATTLFLEISISSVKCTYHIRMIDLS